MAPIHHHGEVTVAPGAHIAADVFLYAHPGSQLEIQAGVCVGEHCIIHVFGGSLVIAAGATLGTGVLVFGNGVIGARASIGAGSTLIQPDIAQEGVVPPGSLVGDPSRRVGDPLLYTLPAFAATQPERPDSLLPSTTQPEAASPVSSPSHLPLKQADSSPAPPSVPLSPTAQVRQQTNGRPIPGQATLQQLLRKISPQRDSLPSSSDS